MHHGQRTAPEGHEARDGSEQPDDRPGLSRFAYSMQFDSFLDEGVIRGA